MAYGEKYKLEWRSPMREQLLYTVSISEQGYSGALKPIYATGDGITITQGGRDDSELTPIKASEATINFLALDNSTIYEELFSLDPMQYRVSIAETRGNITYTKWVGYLSTGSYSQPYAKPPYPITLKANDGIATLKSKMYSNADGTRYASTRSVKSLIEHLLSPLGMGVDIWGYSPINPGEASSPLRQIFVKDDSIYMAFDYETPTYYDVLTELLATLGLQLFQSCGRWVVRSFAALAEPTRPAGWSPIHSAYTSYGDTLPIDSGGGVGVSSRAELSLLPPLQQLNIATAETENDVPVDAMNNPDNWVLYSRDGKKKAGPVGVRLSLGFKPKNSSDQGVMGFAAFAFPYSLDPAEGLYLTLDMDIFELNRTSTRYNSGRCYITMLAIPADIDPIDWLETVNNGHYINVPEGVYVWRVVEDNPDTEEEELSYWEEIPSGTNSLSWIGSVGKEFVLQPTTKTIPFDQMTSEKSMTSTHATIEMRGIPGTSGRYNLVMYLTGEYRVMLADSVITSIELGNARLSMSTNVGLVSTLPKQEIKINDKGVIAESYAQSFYEGTAQPISAAFFLPSLLNDDDIPIRGFITPTEGVMLSDVIGSKLRAMRSGISRQLDGEVYVPAPIDLNTLWHDSEGRVYYTNYVRHLMKRGLYEVQLREMKPLSALPSFDLSSYGYPSDVVGLDTSLYFKTTINNYVYRLSVVDSTVQLVLQTSNDTILSKGNGCICIIETDSSTSTPTYKAYAYDDSGILLSKVDNILDAIRISNGSSEDYVDYQGALAQSALYDVSTQTWIAAGNKNNGSEYIVVLIDSAGGQIFEQTISGIVNRLCIMSNGFVIEERTSSASSLWHSHAYQAELTPISVDGLGTNDIIVAINDIYIVVQNAETGMLSIYPRKDSKVTIDTSSPLYSVAGRVIAINGALVLMKGGDAGVGIVYDGRVGEAYNIPNATVADTLALVGDSVLVINNGIVTRYRLFGTQVDSVATLLLASTGETITDADGNVIMVKSVSASENTYTSKYTGAQIDELLGKAGTAYQKPSAGIPLSDLSQEVKDAISAGGSGGGGSLNSVDIAVDSSSTNYIEFTHEGIDDDGLQEYTVKVLTKNIEDNGDGVARTTNVRTYLTKRLSAKVL